MASAADYAEQSGSSGWHVMGPGGRDSCGPGTWHCSASAFCPVAVEPVIPGVSRRAWVCVSPSAVKQRLVSRPVWAGDDLRVAGGPPRFRELGA